MTPIYLFLVLVIQCSFIHADTDKAEDKEALRETLKKPDFGDDPTALPNWFKMLAIPNNNNTEFPTSSASMMARIANSNKTLEEQLTDIKDLAKQISTMLETEMVSMFSEIATVDKDEKTGARKKRSVETPMDCAKIVMKLLNHIKSNNECQNLAIDNLLSAQRIAGEIGIQFKPDPEILTDLAVAANEHAQEMTNLLKNACTLKNVTEKVEFVPMVEEPERESINYYSYGVYPESEPAFEFLPDIISKPKPAISSHVHYTDMPYYNYPYESQAKSVPAHHHHSAPVSSKPSFYDSCTYPYTPVDYYSSYSVEPVLVIPVDEPEPEPELVGEEVEETITSKMIVEKGDEPGATTVNHVTSYTISEKSHFKPPQIEQLPEHFQYCFLLM